MPQAHVPVLATELVEALDPQPGQVAIDCTLGAGGHARMVAGRGDVPRGCAEARNDEEIAALTQQLRDDSAAAQKIRSVASFFGHPVTLSSTRENPSRRARSAQSAPRPAGSN